MFKTLSSAFGVGVAFAAVNSSITPNSKLCAKTNETGTAADRVKKNKTTPFINFSK